MAIRMVPYFMPFACLIPRAQMKVLLMVGCICIPSAREAETGGSLELADHQLDDLRPLLACAHWFWGARIS